MNTDSSLPASEQPSADVAAGEYRVAEFAALWKPSPPQVRFVVFSCSSCQLRHEVAEFRAGQPVECPDCGRTNIVPPYREIASRSIELTTTALDMPTLPMGNAPPPRPFSLLHTKLFPEKLDGEVEVPQEPETGVMLGGPSGDRPRWPLVQGVFNFPFTKEQAFQLAILASWLAIETWFFNTMAEYSPLWVLHLGGYLLLFLINIPYMALLSSMLMEILERTASGMDRGIGWSSADWFDWIVDLGRIAMAALLTLLLTACLFALLWQGQAPPIIGILGAMLFLFPILLLSMLESGSFAGIYSRWVWSSLWTSRTAWAGFYLLSAVLLQAVVLGSLLSARYLGPEGSILPTSILAVAGLMIYFRMLGRMVWFIPVTRPSSSVDRHTGRRDEHRRKFHLWWTHRPA